MCTPTSCCLYMPYEIFTPWQGNLAITTLLWYFVWSPVSQCCHHQLSWQGTQNNVKGARQQLPNRTEGSWNRGEADWMSTSWATGCAMWHFIRRFDLLISVFSAERKMAGPKVKHIFRYHQKVYKKEAVALESWTSLKFRAEPTVSYSVSQYFLNKSAHFSQLFLLLGTVFSSGLIHMCCSCEFFWHCVKIIYCVFMILHEHNTQCNCEAHNCVFNQW